MQGSFQDCSSPEVVLKVRFVLTERVILTEVAKITWFLLALFYHYQDLRQLAIKRANRVNCAGQLQIAKPPATLESTSSILVVFNLFQTFAPTFKGPSGFFAALKINRDVQQEIIYPLTTAWEIGSCRTLLKETVQYKVELQLESFNDGCRGNLTFISKHELCLDSFAYYLLIYISISVYPTPPCGGFWCRFFHVSRHVGKFLPEATRDPARPWTLPLDSKALNICPS